MTITINDESQRLSDGSTLLDLIQKLQLTERTGIAVAVNEAVVTRSAWPDWSLNETDRVTIIQATQGG